MKKFKWSNVLLHGSRTPELFLKTENGLQVWDEKSQKGIIGIIHSACNGGMGKWRGTDYEVGVSDNVVAFQWVKPMDGYGKTWQEIAECVTFLAGTGDKVSTAKEVVSFFRAAGEDHPWLYSAVEAAENNLSVIEGL